MSPRDYQWVKTHHLALVAKARKALASNPLHPELRRKLARELWPLRALRNHHDLNQYLKTPTWKTIIDECHPEILAKCKEKLGL